MKLSIEEKRVQRIHNGFCERDKFILSWYKLKISLSSSFSCFFRNLQNSNLATFNLLKKILLNKAFYLLAIAIFMIGLSMNGCNVAPAKVEPAKANVTEAKGAEDDTVFVNSDMDTKQDGF
jgi:hypothetical protein